MTYRVAGPEFRASEEHDDVLAWLREHGLEPEDVFSVYHEGDECFAMLYVRDAEGALSTVSMDDGVVRPDFVREDITPTRPLP